MPALEAIRNRILSELLEEYPFAVAFFQSNDIEISQREGMSVGDLMARVQEEADEDDPFDAALNLRQLCEYIDQMLAFLSDDQEKVRSLTIRPGTDKDGKPEGFDEITIQAGETVCIVGPTGSGKSRLLGDIEWVAQADTPTGRTILLNGDTPDPKWRFSPTHKLVAQLSQNMNFVMDLSAEEFIDLHAESRMVSNADKVVGKILDQANELAGESFSPKTPITSLSGGQSRALMIADTAILSRSPIVLIDEIENAGIDRRKALELLLAEDKIVLMATHDPVLALMGARRMIISNGGISQVIETTDHERQVLGELTVIDERLQMLRNQLRYGRRLA